MSGQLNAGLRMPGMRIAGQRSGQSMRRGRLRTGSAREVGASVRGDADASTDTGGPDGPVAAATLAEAAGASDSRAIAATGAAVGTDGFLPGSAANAGGAMGRVTTGGTRTGCGCVSE